MFRNPVRSCWLLHFALLSSLMAMSCTAKAPTGEVAGKVTFEGKAVTEGIISFMNPEAGTGDEARLAPDGAYALKAPLPTGDYRVSVMPLVVRENDPKTGFEVATEKPAPDIPQKYRTIGTTDLKAKIEPGKNVHDFNMKR